MIYRHILLLATANAFLTRGRGLVRIKAVDSITRPFLSRSDGWNLQWEDEMKRLEDKRAEYKRELLTVVDSGERTAITKQMTAITKQITELLTTQRGYKNSPVPLRF
jgi:hypothetical protein